MIKMRITSEGPVRHDRIWTFCLRLSAAQHQRKMVLLRGSQASAAEDSLLWRARASGKCTLDCLHECFADKKEGALRSNFEPVQMLWWCRVRTGISLLHFNSIQSQAIPLIATGDSSTANVARQIDPWLSAESTSQKLDQQVATVRFRDQTLQKPGTGLSIISRNISDIGRVPKDS